MCYTVLNALLQVTQILKGTIMGTMNLNRAHATSWAEAFFSTLCVFGLVFAVVMGWSHVEWDGRFVRHLLGYGSTVHTAMFIAASVAVLWLLKMPFMVREGYQTVLNSRFGDKKRLFEASNFAYAEPLPVPARSRRELPITWQEAMVRVIRTTADNGCVKLVAAARFRIIDGTKFPQMSIEQFMTKELQPKALHIVEQVAANGTAYEIGKAQGCTLVHPESALKKINLELHGVEVDIVICGVEVVFDPTAEARALIAQVMDSSTPAVTIPVATEVVALEADAAQAVIDSVHSDGGSAEVGDLVSGSVDSELLDQDVPHDVTDREETVIVHASGDPVAPSSRREVAPAESGAELPVLTLKFASEQGVTASEFADMPAHPADDVAQAAHGFRVTEYDPVFGRTVPSGFDDMVNDHQRAIADDRHAEVRRMLIESIDALCEKHNGNLPEMVSEIMKDEGGVLVIKMAGGEDSLMKILANRVWNYTRGNLPNSRAIISGIDFSHEVTLPAPFVDAVVPTPVRNEVPVYRLGDFVPRERDGRDYRNYRNGQFFGVTMPGELIEYAANHLSGPKRVASGN
jgi:hypothetical protein